MAEEWSCFKDMMKDISDLSEFKNDDAAIEINDEIWYSEDVSNDSIVLNSGPCSQLPVERPEPSSAKIMDRIADEVTEGMRQARIIFEDECSFIRSQPKASQESSNEKKKKKKRFTPLQNMDEPKGSFAPKENEWTPMKPADAFSVKRDEFPALNN